MVDAQAEVGDEVAQASGLGGELGGGVHAFPEQAPALRGQGMPLLAPAGGGPGESLRLREPARLRGSSGGGNGWLQAGGGDAASPPSRAGVWALLDSNQ